MCERRVNLLVSSLSLHRHSSIGFILAFASSIHNKQLFLHAHREASALSNEIPEESEQFRFLRVTCYTNIKGSVILAKASVMRISIPLDLSSRPFIPLPRFMRSRRAATLLAPSLEFTPR